MTPGENHDDFEQARPRLIGIAYRILGSFSDAEDAVQDTYVKWLNADRKGIVNPDAWLTTVCTRRCIDMRRAHDRSRVDYVGEWLPEPVETDGAPNPEDQAELASSLNTAFLLVLERLTPKERAAYLLREVFDVAYPEIAAMLETSETACRKLVSRAAANVREARARHVTPAETQVRLLDAFRDAIRTGEAGDLGTLLAADVTLRADGGGKVPAILRPVNGQADVVRVTIKKLSKYWADSEWEIAKINGGIGILLRDGGEIAAAVSFSYDTGGLVSGIYIVRNPEKLAHLGHATMH